MQVVQRVVGSSPDLLGCRVCCVQATQEPVDEALRRGKIRLFQGGRAIGGEGAEEEDGGSSDEDRWSDDEEGEEGESGDEDEDGSDDEDGDDSGSEDLEEEGEWPCGEVEGIRGPGTASGPW